MNQLSIELFCNYIIRHCMSFEVTRKLTVAQKAGRTNNMVFEICSGVLHER